jgi:hypothetical protein
LVRIGKSLVRFLGAPARRQNKAKEGLQSGGRKGSLRALLKKYVC